MTDGFTDAADLTAAGDHLFFADDGTNGLQLWTSDGTTAGTTPVTGVTDGLAFARTPVVIGEHIFFLGKDDTNG